MKTSLKAAFPYVSMIGLLAYVAVYAFGAKLYAGGSLNFPDHEAFSFFHNFLCDLMHPVGLEGSINDARGFGVVSHIILSIAMMGFFYLLPLVVQERNSRTRWIQVLGVSSMAVFSLMFTPYHDLVVTITGTLGALALIPFFLQLKGFPNKGFVVWAYLCFGLSLLVFFIFETKLGFYYLPFIQKLTFIADAIWVFWTCLIILRKPEVLSKLRSNA